MGSWLQERGHDTSLFGVKTVFQPTAVTTCFVILFSQYSCSDNQAFFIICMYHLLPLPLSLWTSASACISFSHRYLSENVWTMLSPYQAVVIHQCCQWEQVVFVSLRVWDCDKLYSTFMQRLLQFTTHSHIHNTDGSKLLCRVPAIRNSVFCLRTFGQEVPGIKLPPVISGRPTLPDRPTGGRQP